MIHFGSIYDDYRTNPLMWLRRTIVKYLKFAAREEEGWSKDINNKF